jgi:toxin ParE1/3/4
VRQLVYLASARRDLNDILLYVVQTSGSFVVARRFVDVLMQQCRKMASLPPILGRPRPEIRHDIRSFAFKNYLILFRYEDDALQVVNILEGHRDILGAFRDDEI